MCVEVPLTFAASSVVRSTKGEAFAVCAVANLERATVCLSIASSVFANTAQHFPIIRDAGKRIDSRVSISEVAAKGHISKTY